MKKIPTLFVREFENHKIIRVTEQVTPGMEWVLNGDGIATIKWDGTCCMIKNGELYIEAIWGRSVAHAVEAISRSDEEPYMTYIERLSRNPIATQVKIQDLKHNMLPERNLTVSGMVSLDFRSLRKRYEKALAYLTKKTGG